MLIKDKINKGWSDLEIKQYFKITTKQLEKVKNENKK